MPDGESSAALEEGGGYLDHAHLNLPSSAH